MEKFYKKHWKNILAFIGAVLLGVWVVNLIIPGFIDVIFPMSSLPIFDGWNPHTARHCVDSLVAVIGLTLLRVGIIYHYIVINRMWARAAAQASDNSRRAFTRLRWIFLTCSNGGYASLIVAIWFPQLGVAMMAIFMIIDNYLCNRFILISDELNFIAIGEAESIGSEVLMRMPEMAKMSKFDRGELIAKLVKIQANSK